MRAALRTMLDGLLAARPVSSLARSVTKHHLRVLAYHGIADADAFAWQMHHIRTRYNPVSTDDVMSAILDLHPMPPLSVWVTFDDAVPSVVDRGLPALLEYRIEAAMFVCPRVVDTDEPLWWQVVEEVYAAGISEEALGEYGRLEQPQAIRKLKGLQTSALLSVIDDARRAYETILEQPCERRQITSAELERFRQAGGAVGNHTHNHYLLSNSEPSVQTQEIHAAHDWLADFLAAPPELFAYPNGNHTAVAEDLLDALDYKISLLFDHNFARVGRNPMQMSRLRVSDQNPRERFVSILAGTHVAIHQARTRFTHSRGRT